MNPFTATLHKDDTGQNAVAVAEQQRAIAEVQAALMIARANPRNQVAAMDRILNACTRPTLAASALYTYSRGGSDITGPSIRLAEAIAQNWGNIQFGIRELDQRNTESTVQAFAWDVETNTRREVTFQVPHVRQTKQGKKRLEDPRDIYEMIANQGARRVRACILSVVPGDVVEAAVEQCGATLTAHADTCPEAVKKLLEAFQAFGVTKEQIESRIQRRMDAIQPAQIIALRKIYVSLKDGMSAPEDWFDAPAQPPLAQNAPSQSSPPPASHSPYPADKFAENLPKWRDLISSGKKTTEEIIQILSLKNTLSNEQKAAISGIPETAKQKTGSQQ